MRTLLAALALSALLLAACDGAGTTDETADPGADPVGDVGDAGLPEGAAATVDGTEIPAAEVDARVEAATESEDVAAQLEGEDAEQLISQFRAQTLSVLVQTRILLDGAEELGAAPSQEDVEAARADLVEQVGGEEAFAEAVESSGMSVAALDDQLRGIAAIDAIGAELVERGELGDLPEGAQGDPEQLAVQQWLGERVASADVVVHPSYGEWDPQSGSVVAPLPPAAPGDGDDGS